MTRARIHTEDCGDAVEIARIHFDCFAVFRGEGYWKGKKENALVIEVLDLHNDTREFRNVCENCADEIKRSNGQDAILLTFETLQGELW